MKKAMHLTNILRALMWLLALSFLLSTAATPVFASGDDTAQAEAYMTWEYFPSTSMVNGRDPATDTVYRYSQVTVLSARIRFIPEVYFQYANTVEVDGTDTTLRAPDYGSHFVLLGNGTLMSTNDGKKTLNRLAQQRTFYSYRLTRGDLFCGISEETLRSIANTYGKQKQAYSLFDLRNKTFYTVLGFNEDGWFGVPVAFIFEMDDGLYYASALDLTDDCFDEEGGLRPKSSVNLYLYPLSEEVTSEAYRVIRGVNFHLPHYTYESGSSLPGGDEISVAIVSIAFLGLLLPVAPITLGLCFSHSQKMGRKKRWYLLALLGGAWLLLGILVLILTIIAF
ncbi:MAG: hypothetical protein IJA91_05725 [Clostridia bacterium]|nr:hypothetical protein [Clostridia bacterium]